MDQLIDKWETKMEFDLFKNKKEWNVDSTYLYYELQEKMRKYFIIC
jgi:hypothetical protein